MSSEAPPAIAATPRPQRLRSPTASYDLLALLALAAALPALALLPPLLRLPLGIVAALMAPGYATAAALFPRRDDLSGVMRAALCFGLSVAALPFLATVLDRLPWGIRHGPMVGALSLWIGGWSLVALAQRQLLLAQGAAWVARPSSGAAGGRSRHAIRNALLGLLLAGSIYGAVGLVLRPQPDALAFYALGRRGQALDYPRLATRGEPQSVTLGLAGDDLEGQRFRLEIWVSDPAHRAHRRQLVKEEPNIPAARGSLEWTATWTMPWAGEDQRVELLLFRAAESVPYRRLLLWMDVEE